MAFRHGMTPIATMVALAIGGGAFAQEDVSRDTVVATVNGTDITLGHMIVLRQNLPQQYQQLPADVLFNGILDQLVQQTLLAEGVTDLSPAAQLLLDNETRSLRAADSVSDITENAVTDDALQAAYDAEFADFTPTDEYNASHILVETEEEAQALVEELAGGADFATLAQEKSTGPSGPNGGSLGWFGQGAMVAPFEAAVVAMEVGTVSAPVQTQFGWHVIRLNETRETSAPALEEVRGQLADNIRRQAIEDQVATLEADATVERIEAGSINPQVLNDLTLIEQ